MTNPNDDGADPTGRCLYCRRDHPVGTHVHGEPLMRAHNHRSAPCAGAGMPAMCGDPAVDEFRTHAVERAHQYKLAERVHRQEVVALVADPDIPHTQVLERVAAMMEAELSCGRWRALAHQTGYVPAAYSAVAFLTAGYTPSGSVDAFVDARFREATHRWLREVSKREDLDAPLAGLLYAIDMNATT